MNTLEAFFYSICSELGHNVCLHESFDVLENGSYVVKTRSSYQTLVNTLEAIILVRMLTYIKVRMSLKLGHVESKSRSLGQIIEKPFEHLRGHMFESICSELGQNVCLHKSLEEVEERVMWGHKLGH